MSGTRVGTLIGTQPQAGTRLQSVVALVFLAAGVTVAQLPPPVEPAGRKPDPPKTAADDAKGVPKEGPEVPPTVVPNEKYKFDADRLYFKTVEDLTPLGDLLTSRDDAAAYTDLLEFANRFTAAELIAHGRKDVSLGDLLHEKREHRDGVRYELVRLSGRLKRLIDLGPTPAGEALGVKQRCEAWVFDDARQLPVCVHLTEPPVGVDPETDITPSRPVVVAGYFFKVVQYTSAEPSRRSPDGSVTRRVPLLIGKNIQVGPPDDPKAAAQQWNLGFLPLALGGVGVILCVVIGLSLWFKRTDRGAREAADRRRNNPFE